MDSAGAALIITVLAGIAVILAAVFLAARREQRRNDDQIAAGPRSDWASFADRYVRQRRSTGTHTPRRSNGRGWGTDDTPDQSLMRGVADRTAARFEIQQTHYANALRQSTTYFYFSLGVGLVGFALLAVGVGIAMADRLEVGTVTAHRRCSR